MKNGWMEDNFIDTVFGIDMLMYIENDYLYIYK